MENVISNKLIIWYMDNKRDLPWRGITNPYYIWISEIILQQTRVVQGLPYYIRFVETFPTVADLAAAPQDLVLKLWQGLGYYSRARNMQHAARQIMDSYGGKFPDTFQELLKLKGVGTYTAAAIASLAFREAVPVVDGNVIRVLTRLFAIEGAVEKPEVSRDIRQIASDLLIRDKPDLFNQAIMEFGALQCVPVNPDCLHCPLIDHCLAHKYNQVSSFPRKATKVKVRDRYFYYMVIRKEQHIFFRKRSAGDIWEGLYEFPLIETTTSLTGNTFQERIHQFMSDDVGFTIEKIYPQVKHILTHQRLWVCFTVIHLTANMQIPEDWIPVATEDMKDMAVPRVIDIFLNQEFINKDRMDS